MSAIYSVYYIFTVLTRIIGYHMWSVSVAFILLSLNRPKKGLTLWWFVWDLEMVGVKISRLSIVILFVCRLIEDVRSSYGMYSVRHFFLFI
jgi:hypothetical protein